MSDARLTSSRIGSKLILAAVMVGLIITAASAFAQTFTVLYSFAANDDGQNPYGRLRSGAAGHLIGTTLNGGVYGCGRAFQLRIPPTGEPPWQEILIYDFRGKPDACNPYGGLVADSEGDFYGTTYAGGANGEGAVFELFRGARGIEAVLYSFGSSAQDGINPQGALITDASGSFYGTTDSGGAYGKGTVFELAESDGKWIETVIYSFKGQPDGATPYAALHMDTKGNLYGTTYYGGTDNLGTVFELSPSATGWTETVLENFTGSSSGAYPLSDLQGNLYGTTQGGGAHGEGTVFQIKKDEEVVLYSFCALKDCADGANPAAGVVRDDLGNTYGVTTAGGAYGHGTVFEVTKAGVETVLHSFTGGADGAYPAGDLIIDSKGNLYGTARSGGNTGCSNGCGVVFEVTP